MRHSFRDVWVKDGQTIELQAKSTIDAGQVRRLLDGAGTQNGAGAAFVSTPSAISGGLGSPSSTVSGGPRCLYEGGI